MTLYIRMILYGVFAGAVGHGVASFDPETGIITMQIDDLAKIVAGFIGYLGTFGISRIVKRNGGAT